MSYEDKYLKYKNKYLALKGKILNMQDTENQTVEPQTVANGDNSFSGYFSRLTNLFGGGNEELNGNGNTDYSSEQASEVSSSPDSQVKYENGNNKDI